MPRGGFGNLIALPLQKGPRAEGRSVFVDDRLKPYPDQWSFLASLRPFSPEELEQAVLQAGEGRHPLDIDFTLDDDETPWRQTAHLPARPDCALPESLSVVAPDRIFIPKEGLPRSLANRMIRLPAFPNPEFHKRQAIRRSVWDKPRIIGCAESFPQHIGLPRGCMDACLEKSVASP